MAPEFKYKLADQLAPHFSNLVSGDRKTAFGVILNATIRFRGRLTSLKNEFAFEDAAHITNLVLCRIYANRIIEVDIDDDEVYKKGGEDLPF